MKFLPLVWKNLFRRKIRALFTVLSILVAFMLFAYLAAVRVAFSLGVEVAGADRMITMHKVSFIQPLPEAYQGRIEAVEGVIDVTHASWFGGIYQDPQNFFAQFAVVPEDWLRMYPEYLLEDAEREVWLGNRTGAVVGRDLADRFGWEVGDRIPLQGTIYRTQNGGPWEFTIDGIFEADQAGVDTSQFFFDYEYLAEGNTQGRGTVGYYVIRIDDPARSVDVAAAVDERFANSQAETKTSTEQAFAQEFANQVGDVGSMITAIVIAVLFTILLVTANTMAQSIRERTGELAVLKTLGFSNLGVLVLVLAESLLIAVVGGALGRTIGYVLISQGDPTGGFLPAFFVPPRDLVIGSGLALPIQPVNATVSASISAGVR